MAQNTYFLPNAKSKIQKIIKILIQMRFIFHEVSAEDKELTTIICLKVLHLHLKISLN